MFAAYASRYGHGLIDRRLYLPEGWAEDPARRAGAKVPEEVAFATKPAMAREMVSRVLDEDIPCAFVLADAIYGLDYRFRRMLEDRGQAYVLAVRSNHVLRFLDAWDFVQTDPATLIGDLEAQAWQALSAGDGAKGARLYDWARLPLSRPAADGFGRWLLARRSLREPEAIACYFSPMRRRIRPWPIWPPPQACAGPSRNACLTRQGRSRARSLRGPLLAGMAPSHEPCHGRRRIPGQAQCPTAPQRLR